MLQEIREMTKESFIRPVAIMNYVFPVDALLETCAQEMHDYRTLQSIIQEGKGPT